MTFFVYDGSQLHHSFEADTHRAALAQCQDLPQGWVLRNWQQYAVTPETVRQCEIFSDLDRLTNGETVGYGRRFN